MDALAYTRSELEKQLELLQIHLTQHERLDFCLDCVRKHWAAIEGLSEEGIVFTDSPGEKKLFESMAIWSKEWRDNLPRTDEAFVIADKEARVFRKDVVLSPLLAKIEPILAATGTKDYTLHLVSPNPGPQSPEGKDGKPLIASNADGKGMPITKEGTAINVGYGLVDVGLIEVDIRRTYAKSFRNLTDWERLLLYLGTGISKAANVRMSGLAEEARDVLFYSSGPKFIESLYDLVKTEGAAVASTVRTKLRLSPPPIQQGAGQKQAGQQQYGQTVWG